MLRWGAIAGTIACASLTPLWCSIPGSRHTRTSIHNRHDRSRSRSRSSNILVLLNYHLLKYRKKNLLCARVIVSNDVPSPLAL